QENYLSGVQSSIYDLYYFLDDVLPYSKLLLELIISLLAHVEVCFTIPKAIISSKCFHTIHGVSLYEQKANTLNGPLLQLLILFIPRTNRVLLISRGFFPFVINSHLLCTCDLFHISSTGNMLSY